MNSINFAEMITSSVFARGLALLILAMALLGAIVVAAVDYLTGHTVPAEVINFLYIGLGAALAVTGINFGVVLQPAPKPSPSPIPAPGGTANVSQP